MQNSDATRIEQARKEARDAKNPLRLRDLLLPAAFAAGITYAALNEDAIRERGASMYEGVRGGIESVTQRASEGFSDLGAIVQNRAQTWADDAYVPHIEAIEGTAAGYVELAPAPGQGLDGLARLAWPVSSENERNAMRRIVMDLNGLESVGLQAGRSYLVPVHPDFADRYGLNTEQ